MHCDAADARTKERGGGRVENDNEDDNEDDDEEISSKMQAIDRNRSTSQVRRNRDNNAYGNSIILYFCVMNSPLLCHYSCDNLAILPYIVFGLLDLPVINAH
jgi:hypothetical protein